MTEPLQAKVLEDEEPVAPPIIAVPPAPPELIVLKDYYIPIEEWDEGIVANERKHPAERMVKLVTPESLRQHKPSPEYIAFVIKPQYRAPLFVRLLCWLWSLVK